MPRNNARRLAHGFEAREIRVVHVKDPDNEIWVYLSSWRGAEQLHCRNCYVMGGEWHPGKGWAVPIESAGETIRRIAAAGAKLP